MAKNVQHPKRRETDEDKKARDEHYAKLQEERDKLPRQDASLWKIFTRKDRDLFNLKRARNG